MRINAQDTDSLNLAYEYYNSGQTQEAINLFENYVKVNPNDTKIFLQLGFAYNNINDFDNAIKNFDYVINNSINVKEISKAKIQKSYIEDDKKNLVTKENLQIIDTTVEKDPMNELNLAYKELNDGNNEKAISLFENYSKSNPTDTRVSLQLAYLYFNIEEYNKSLDKFEIVSANSKDDKEIDAAKQSIYVLRQMMPMYSKFSNDLYFYNIYDSYQKNYILNFIDHWNTKIAKNVYTGFYLDLFMDSRSKPEVIYNDRYIEFGGFWKVFFLKYFIFELRAGLVREIDFNNTKFNVKPILTFGYRLGEPNTYSGVTTKKKVFLYADVYSTVLYDHKFKNVFGQIYLREAVRFLTGGYSYFEFYLGQNVLGDTKQYDFNNYGEISAGINFKPNIINFPLLFVEATNKYYWLGGPTKNSFQVKAGFLLNFNLPL
jgi:tetratricopeptide (TPR) repeat protein